MNIEWGRGGFSAGDGVALVLRPPACDISEPVSVIKDLVVPGIVLSSALVVSLSFLSPLIQPRMRVNGLQMSGTTGT